MFFSYSATEKSRTGYEPVIHFHISPHSSWSFVFFRLYILLFSIGDQLPYAPESLGHVVNLSGRATWPR